MILRTPFDIAWHDSGKEPECSANPAYPEGVALDLSQGAGRTRTVALPYPADRIGAYVVTCNRCGVINGCTTAGRADDPRSMKVACKELAH